MSNMSEKPIELNRKMIVFDSLSGINVSQLYPLKKYFFDQIQSVDKPGVLLAREIDIGSRRYVLRLSSYRENDPLTTQGKNVLKARLSLVDPENKRALPKESMLPILNMSINRGELSACEVIFDELENDIMEIMFRTATRTSQRGNGYGLFLRLLSDDVISTMIRIYPEVFVGKAVTEIIVDVARQDIINSGQNRISLASKVAEQLGYERVNNRGKYPCYKKPLS